MSTVTRPVPAAEPLFTPRFWLACSMHFTGAMALSLYILFPLFIRHLGGSEFTIGLYAGLTGAAAVAARLPIGFLLDTQGRRRVLAGAGLLHVLSWLGFPFIAALNARALAHVLVYGFASGSLFASYFTYASDIVPASRRSEGIAMFAIWGMLPNGLGPLLGEFLIHGHGFRTYFLVAAGFATLSFCLSQLLPESGSRPHAAASGTPLPGRVPWHLLAFLLATTLVFGAAVNSVFTFLAPFAQSTGRGGVGLFFLSYAAAAVAVRVLTGRLPDRLGLYRVLVPALGTYAVGVILIGHVQARGVLVLVGMMCGAGHGYAFPILNVLTVDRVAAHQRGRAVSWFTAMFDLGNTLANPVLGLLAERAGYATMFTVSGVGVLAAAVVVLYKRPAPPSRHDPGTPA